MIWEYALIGGILFGLMLLYLKVAGERRIMDIPNSRSSHTQAIISGGGIVFYAGVLLYSIWHDMEYPWFFTGLTLVTMISLMDDIRSVPKGVRLTVHIAAVLCLCMQLNMYDVSWYTFLIINILIVGFLNVYNFMDGINGLTGGYSLIAIAGFWYINNGINIQVYTKLFIYQ